MKRLLLLLLLAWAAPLSAQNEAETRCGFRPDGTMVIQTLVDIKYVNDIEIDQPVTLPELLAHEQRHREQMIEMNCTRDKNDVNLIVNQEIDAYCAALGVAPPYMRGARIALYARWLYNNFPFVPEETFQRVLTELCTDGR